MTCQQVQTNLSLYLYGELDFAQEDAIERHLEACALCQSALSREKSWHASLKAEQPDVSFELLSKCRDGLRSALRGEGQGGTKPALWKRLFPVPVSATRWSAQIAAASFLVLAGFTAARLIDGGYLPRFLPGPALNGASLVNAPTERVRDIQPDGQNGVRITVDRVQQNEVTGNVNDDVVRQLLLNAMRDPTDPGIRVDSVEMLQRGVGSDVRDALLSSVQHDTNAAVRLKALEGLRRFSNDSKTRQAIEYVLKHDDDPDVRSEAIEILLPSDQFVGIAPDVLTTLQEILNSNQANDYVRSRSQEVLGELNKSRPVY